jgi:hypothetical protein
MCEKRTSVVALHSMLVAYSDDESDGDEPAQTAPVAPLRLPALAATALGAASSSDDDDDDDEPPAKRQAPERVPSAEDHAAQGSSNAQSSLPDFEEAISSAQLPAFLTTPAGEFEHVAFNDRSAPESEVKPAAAAEPAPAASVGGARPSSSATAPEARRDVARGKHAPGAKPSTAEGKEKDKQSLKDRTKEKRKKDQSASFLGGRWKTEEEMHMRDNFDS